MKVWHLLIIIFFASAANYVQATSVGIASPTAMIHIKASDGTANTAPIKFTAGTNLSVVEAGALEYNGTSLLFSTNDLVRHTILFDDADGSSLTNLDADNISAGTLASARGGTGVSNAGTLTYGANNITFTTSGITSLTLPTTGTLATRAGVETFTNKTLTSPTINTPTIDQASLTGNTVFNDAGADADFRAEGDTDASLLFLDASTDRVGIGTINPGSKLEIVGQVKITGGSPGASKRLTSDGAGLATWETVVGGGAFNTASNRTSNSPGTLGTDDFVFGSDQLDEDADTAHQYRFLFDKSKGAFRAGKTTTTAWDDVNRGIASFAGGNDTKASGDYSAAFGYFAEATGDYSFSLGSTSKAIGNYSFAHGYQSEARGDYSVAMGYRAIADTGASAAFSVGSDTVASGNNSAAFGIQSVASGAQSFAVGNITQATGDNSFTMGFDSIAAADTAIAMGYWVESRAANAITMGRGIDDANPIVNNTANSLMIGFNSDVPTFFVGPGDGTSGSIGNVGIGTASPQRALHVDDVMRLEPRSSAPSSAANGDIYYDSSSSDALCVRLNGSWTKVAGGGSCS